MSAPPRGKAAEIARATWAYVRRNKALPALLVLVVVAAFAFDAFFTSINLKNVFRQVSLGNLEAIPVRP